MLLRIKHWLHWLGGLAIVSPEDLKLAGVYLCGRRD